MTIVNQLIDKLKFVQEINESIKTAEKAKISLLKEDAQKKFKSCYESFTESQEIINNFKSGDKEVEELHVLLSEAAFCTENFNIARRVTESFIQMSPQQNQFYCRAKILLGLIIDNESRELNGNESIKQHKLALKEIMEAVDVALLPTNLTRYKFIVFNASVAFWKVANQFLKAGRGKYFVNEFTKMVNALEQQDDSDKEWRIMFLSAAALCCDDDKNSKGSSDYIDKAIEISESLLNAIITTEQKLTTNLKACNDENDKIMSAFRAIEERAELLRKPPKIDPDMPEDYVPPPIEYPPLTGLAAEGYEKVKNLLDSSQKRKAKADAELQVSNDKKSKQQETLTKLYMQRIHSNPGDSKRFAALPQVVKDLRTNTLVQCQTMMSGCVTDKEFEGIFNGLVKKLEDSPSSIIRSETLLDVCRTAWHLKQRNIAIKCFTIASGVNVVSPILRVKIDVCDAMRQLADVNEVNANQLAGQRLSIKQVEGFRANQRIEALKLLERTVGICLSRLDDKFLVQEICLIMWNAMIPLLQSHLVLKVYSCLKCITSALKTVAAPLTFLRTQAHYELSKCEEMTDFVNIAKEEGISALTADYGILDEKIVATTTDLMGVTKPVELDRARSLDITLRPYVEVLKLRSSVFDAPSDAEEMKEVNPKQGSVAKESVDYSLMLLAQGALTIPSVTLEEIEKNVSRPRASVTNSVVNYTPYTQLLQKRCIIMFTIAQMAHSLRDVTLLQQAACFLLSQVWDPQDTMLSSLIDAQVEVLYLLADSLLMRINTLPVEKIKQQRKKSHDIVTGGDSASATTEHKSEETVSDEDSSNDPRALGLTSTQATNDMMIIKKIIIIAIDKGIQLSVLLKDYYGIQNGLIYFWNLHMHVFRYSNYDKIMEEIFEFLKNAVATMDNLKSIPPADVSVSFDERLRLSYLESLTSYYEYKNLLPQAIETANKGYTNTAASEYMRRKICEMFSRLSAQGAAVPAGGKGGGKGSDKDGPKSDNALLTVFATLAQAELPIEIIPKEQSLVLLEKCITLMDSDVATYLKSQVWNDLTQERYSQFIEMQAEIWTRLTRLRILNSDIIGAQSMAERCLKLISRDNLTEFDESNLNARVWRWISVCERLFGIAITNIIQPDGQDIHLQNDLRLAALSHLNLACDYGIRAAREELVVEAAIYAWNVSMPLIEFTELRGKLFQFQRGIINDLLLCTSKAMMPQVMELRQQFYLAMIEGYANIYDWTNAFKIVMEAFDYVSSDLQKPLWQWRVIAMSKKGKNVLEGLQKLKENDPSLQAQVYAILARSSNNPKQQLESYMKAIEILAEEMERVDYLFETAQWMSSTGLPKADIKELLLSAMDALYEVEEKSIPGVADMDAEEAKEELDGVTGNILAGASELQSKKSGRVKESSVLTASMKSLPRSTAAPSQRRDSKVSATASRAGTKRAGSQAASNKGKNSREPEEEKIPPNLNFKQLLQASQGLIMLSIIENNGEKRLEKNIESIYFLKKSLSHWMHILYEEYRLQSYNTLKHEEKEATPYDTYTIPMPDFLMIPEEPIAFLTWTHFTHPKFIELMQLATAKDPLQVPSTQSVSTFPMIIHYIFQVANWLHNEGFSKYAIYCLSWLKMMLHVMNPVGKEAALSRLQLNVISILYSIGLTEEANSLPSFLSATPIATTASGATGAVVTDPNVKFAVTYGDYIKDYLKNASSHENNSDGDHKSSEVVADYTNPFGIFTWTDKFDPINVDIELQLLAVCDSLISFGQITLCQVLVLTLQKKFKHRHNPRAQIQCISLLSKIYLMNGKYSDVIAMIIESKSLMHQAGDSNQYAEHTILINKAYLKLNKVDDAKQEASDAMSLLESLLMIPIDKKQIKQQSEATLLANNVSTVLGGGGSTSVVKSSHSLNRSTAGGGGGGGGSQTTSSSHIKYESSHDNIQSYLHVIFSYVDAQYILAQQQMIEGINTTSIYMDICECLTHCHDYVSDIVGNISILSAKVLNKRASVAMNYLQLLHLNYTITVPIDNYHVWLQDNILMCNEYQTKVMDIYKQLYNQIPPSELIYYPMIVKDPTTGAVIVTTEEIPYKELSLPIVRLLASSQMQLAQYQTIQAMQQSKHLSSTDFNEKPVLNIEQQYLEDTLPRKETKLNDFETPCLDQAAQLTSSALQLYRGTDNSAKCDLYFSLCLMFRHIGEGMFDAMWQRPEATNQLLLSSEGKETREQFSLLIRKHIESGMTTQDIQWSCFALVEAYGAHSPSTAACWLMQLNSLINREWLKSLWNNAMNPVNEIAASLERLDTMEKESLWPSKDILKQINAEKSFLKTMSVAYRRLNVSVDPLQIIALAPPNSAFFCLQYCPNREWIYVSVGIKSTITTTIAAAGSGAAGGRKMSTKIHASDLVLQAPGELDNKHWIIDKLKLDESSRRALQTIKGQHKVWLSDMTKFIASFGDTTSMEFDLEGSNSTYDSKNLKKSERALEERFRALVSDIEAIFAPLLGPDSKVASFIHHIASMTPAEDTAGDKGKAPAPATKSTDKAAVITPPNYSIPVLTLLIDANLQSLPWEAIQSLQPFKGRISRDFSLHLYYHRLQTLLTTSNPSIPPDSNVLPIISSTFKYIVDALNEDHGNKIDGFKRDSLATLLSSNIEKQTIVGSNKWTKVRDRNGLVSLQDWALSMDTSVRLADKEKGSFNTSLMNVSLGRFGSLLSPTEIATMNLEKLSVFLSFDLCHNDTSYRRQNSTDVLKQANDIENELPMNLAALLSLSGTGSIVLHQWSTPFAAQYRFFQQFWNHFANKRDRIVMSVANANNNITGNEEQGTKVSNIKKYIKNSRVVFGLPHVTYNDQ